MQILVTIYLNTKKCFLFEKNHKLKVGECMQKIKMFFAGVKKEMGRVRWPKKKEMIKYSMAVLLCAIILAIFFVFSDLIIAGIRTLVEGLK